MVSSVSTSPQIPLLDKEMSVSPPTFHTKVMGKDVGDILAGLEAADKKELDLKQKKIDNIDEKTKQLATLEEKVRALSNASSALFNQGVGLNNGGAFSQKVPVRLSGPDDVLSVTAGKDTPKLEMEIEVIRLAKKDTVSATEGAPNKTDPLEWNGSFDIGTDGNTRTITLTPDMSLQEVAHKVNAISSETGIQANIITFADEARLTFHALNYADPIVVDKTNVAGGPEVLNKIPSSSVEAAEDLSAVVRYEGIAKDIFYTSNTIPTGDQYPGVSVTLFKEDPGNPVKISLQNDTNAAVEAIGAFIEAFNDLQELSASDDMYRGVGVTAPLGSVSTIMTGFGSNISPEKAQSLAEIGIRLGHSDKGADGKFTFSEAKPTLHVDTERLTEALTQRFDNVAEVFGFTQTSSSSHFTMMSRPTNIAYGDIQVTFTKSDTNVTSAVFTHNGVDYNAVVGAPFEGNVVLEAPEDSLLKGFKVVFDDLNALPDDVETVRQSLFSMSQGIGDKLATKLGTLLDVDPAKGAFAAERQNLLKSKEAETLKFSTLKETLDTKRAREFDKFKLMEIAVAQFEQTAEFIRTFVKTASAA